MRREAGAAGQPAFILQQSHFNYSENTYGQRWVAWPTRAADPRLDRVTWLADLTFSFPISHFSIYHFSFFNLSFVKLTSEMWTSDKCTNEKWNQDN